MSIQVGCEGCGKIYTVDDRFAGKKAKCKTCGAVMTVPGGSPKPAAARTSSSVAGPARKTSSSAAARPASTSSARPAARKPVAVEAKPDPGDFDLSALDAIEQSGEVDHDYVAALPVAAPRHDAAATTSSRPKGTVYRPTGAVTKVGGRQVAAAANVPGTFWESLKPGPAGYVFLGVLVLGALAIASAKASAYAALAFGALGIIFMVLAKLMMLSLASQEGFTTYLMYRFVPLYDFYYLVSRWQDTQKATSTWLKGAAMLLLALGLMVRAGGDFLDVLGSFHRQGRPQVAANGGARANPNASSNSKEDDPDHDDLDDDPSLTLPQKLAMRHARARQKEIDALGLRKVEPLPWKEQADFPPLPDPGTGDGLQEYGFSLNGEFLGQPMAMVMWVPEGNHAPHSLPCIFVPPMNSPEMVGSTRHEIDEKFKMLAKEGFAVVSYDASRFSDNNRPQFPGSNEEELIQSDCAVHFAHNAMNYVIQRATMVDPERLYAAGEGGAGRLVLYLAAVDPRIKAVATMNPVCDVTRNASASLQEQEKEARLAGIEEFAKRTSPFNNVEKLKCPILVVSGQPSGGARGFAFGFGGGGDGPGSPGDINTFTEALQKLGRPITVQPPAPPAEGQDAYQALFSQWGKWFKSLPATTSTTKPAAGG
jgi:ribosomal protein S27E